jgi:hypothetical protein
LIIWFYGQVTEPVVYALIIAVVPLRAVVGVADTTKVVAFVTELTSVLAGKAPVPEKTITV